MLSRGRTKMITRCKKTHRIEFNSDIGIRRKNLHMYHRRSGWVTATPEARYVMKCYKCSRVMVTDEPLSFQRSQKGCSHGWECYGIYEKFEVYKFEE